MRVSDFGIKDVMQKDLDHLIHSIEKHYLVMVGLEGKEFVKIESKLGLQQW